MSISQRTCFKHNKIALFITLLLGNSYNAYAISCAGGCTINGTTDALDSNAVVAETSGTNTPAISVTNSGSLTGGAGADITGSGHGIYTNNGTLNLDGGSTKGKVTVAGSNADGIFAEQNSTVALTNFIIDSDRVGLYIYDGSTANVSNLNITTRQNASAAIRSSNGSNIVIDGNIDITTAGQHAYGLYSNATIISDENNEFAGTASAITTTNNATIAITTSGTESHGVYVKGNSTIDVKNINIKTNGTNADGIRTNTGTATLQNAFIDTSANGINVYGDASVTLLDSTVKAADSSVRFETKPYHAATVTLNNTIAEENNGQLIHVLATSQGIVNLINNASAKGITVNDGGTGHLDFNIASGSTWLNTGNSEMTNLSLNDANIIFEQPTSNNYKQIMVYGDYAGNGGTITFNTELHDDNSATDKLVIAGSTHAGTTYVTVNNMGGTGAQTVNGIELITVAGNSNGTFTQSGRIVAGSYEYFLNRGNGSTTSTNNWYLTNQLTTIAPPVLPPVVPPVVPPVTPPVTPPPVTPQPQKPAPVLRPEIGSYIANIAAANTMFIHRLHDRLGETQYTDVLSNEERVTSMWMRHIGGHNRFKEGSGQLKTQSNRYVVQIGGDIAQWYDNDLNRYHLGMMAGYANHHNSTQAHITGYTSKGKTEGYHVGIYGTWYDNDKEKSGTYIDTWLTYSWFDHTVSGQGLRSEKYESDGLTASIETGYTHKLGERERDNVSFYVQPKAQVIYMGVKANDHTESNGTRVSSKGDDNIQTRLGVRLYKNGHSSIDMGKNRVFEPFVEANWIHNTNSFGVTMDGVTHKQSGARNVGEIKLGVEAQLNHNLNTWINVAQQVGGSGYSDTQAILGVKYNF